MLLRFHFRKKKFNHQKPILVVLFYISRFVPKNWLPEVLACKKKFSLETLLLEGLVCNMELSRKTQIRQFDMPQKNYGSLIYWIDLRRFILVTKCFQFNKKSASKNCSSSKWFFDGWFFELVWIVVIVKQCKWNQWMTANSFFHTLTLLPIDFSRAVPVDTLTIPAKAALVTVFFSRQCS